MTAARDFWIFPPEVFFDLTYVRISTNEKGLTTIDLDLASKRRGAPATNRERLQHLKENWTLLSNRSLAGANEST
jgi:hypothetical protein